MNRGILQPRTWLNLLGALILAAGLGSAAWIYQRAETSQPVMLENTKLYSHNLEVIGGKFVVIMDDFSRWFAGLWQGKSLAVMIGGATIIIALGLFYAANYLPKRLRPEARDEHED
jgi:hypothetical protein